MKRVKLGLLAIALLGTVAAFATKHSSADLPCDQANINDKCLHQTNVECCIAEEALQFDGSDYEQGETVIGLRVN